MFQEEEDDEEEQSTQREAVQEARHLPRHATPILFWSLLALHVCVWLRVLLSLAIWWHDAGCVSLADAT